MYVYKQNSQQTFTTQLPLSSPLQQIQNKSRKQSAATARAATAVWAYQQPFGNAESPGIQISYSSNSLRQQYSPLYISAF